jgi:hypothetical protein
MKKHHTGRERQRTDFVDNLHFYLKKNAAKAMKDYQKHLDDARDYLQDGLDENEAIELLIVDGLNREAAKNCVLRVTSEKIVDGDTEFSFQFEDIYGRVWSSHDVGLTVFANNDDEAWEKAEISLEEKDDLEPERVISVSRI